MSEKCEFAPVVAEDTEVVYPSLDSAATDGDLDLLQIYKRDLKPSLTAEQEIEYAQRIENGLFAARLKDHPEEQSPNKIETDELEWLIADGERAMNDFCASAGGLVIGIAKRYQNHGVPLLDIIQEGNKGMLHAIKKFDYTKGIRFSTYATYWIKRDIGRGMVENSRNRRLPREQYEAVVSLKKTCAVFYQTHARNASIQELAVEMDESEERIIDLFIISADTTSLDDPIDADETATLGMLVADHSDEEMHERAEHVELRMQLDALLGELGFEQQEVLRRSSGLHDGRQWPSREISAELGHNPQWAVDAKRRAMARLRTVASPALRELLA